RLARAGLPRTEIGRPAVPAGGPMLAGAEPGRREGPDPRLRHGGRVVTGGGARRGLVGRVAPAAAGDHRCPVPGGSPAHSARTSPSKVGSVSTASTANRAGQEPAACARARASPAVLVA